VERSSRPFGVQAPVLRMILSSIGNQLAGAGAGAEVRVLYGY
jgi:hypothetical protein